MSTNFIHSILHVDADAFFVSCEEARRPDLKGKPVVTGLERGVVSALNYKAKACGLRRAMSVKEAKRICPNLVFLPADYRNYILYSKRMYNIVKRFSGEIEEYSIDECFANLSGFKDQIALAYKIKQSLDKELGFSFSLGLAPNKVLAKVASNWQKPNGLTIIKKTEINNYLKDLKLQAIWGIGQRSADYLNGLGIFKAIDLVNKDYNFIKKLAKPYQEIYFELKGNLIYQINTEKKLSYSSISKTKSFQASSNYNYIFSQLSTNLEQACIKLRLYNLLAKKMTFFIKTNDFKIHQYKINFDFPKDNPIDIISCINKYLPVIYCSNLKYRSTGIILSSLLNNNYYQADLFTNNKKQLASLFNNIDKISQKFGDNKVFLAASLEAKNEFASSEKILNIPYLGRCY